MNYLYRVYTAEKKIIEGSIEAASEILAEEALYQSGYARVLTLEPRPAKQPIEEILPTLFGVKPSETIEFTSQLATLLASGVPVLTALRLLRSQSKKKALKSVIETIIEDIQGGNRLSSAMSQLPKVFPDSYCQLLRAGEQAGDMEAGLRQAGGLLERQQESARKVKKALRYPLLVILVAVAVIILMMTVALPPIIDLFTSFDAELPWTTKLLISISNGIMDNGTVILLTILFLVFAGVLLNRLESVRLWRDGFILQLPVLGALATERSVERFSRTTAMLLKAGLRLPMIFDIVIRAETNLVLKAAYTTVKERMVQGEGLSRPMTENSVFPSLIVEMITVGENTGTIDSALETMSAFYEGKVNRRLDALIAMIEPTMTAIIGAIVIFIALSMITPLYSVMRSIY